MPLYDYQCELCQRVFEIMVPLHEADHKRDCQDCGGLLARILTRPPAIHGEVFQTKAILSNGQKVPGHFGKSAPLRRKK